MSLNDQVDSNTDEPEVVPEGILRVMIVMEGSHRLSIEQMSSFLAASGSLEMEARTAEHARQIVAQVLSARQYRKLSKPKRNGPKIPDASDRVRPGSNRI
jgi:hypothetical protein